MTVFKELECPQKSQAEAHMIIISVDIEIAWMNWNGNLV